MNLILRPWHLLLFSLVGSLSREQLEIIGYLKEENRCLKEQLGSKRLRFTDNQRRRLAVRAKALGRKVLLALETVVTPDTLLRWHRELIAKKYDGVAKRNTGRPPVRKEIRDLVTRMARANSGWGYTKIVGVLKNLGYEISRSTVANIPREAGLEPAPERKKKTTWADFLRVHWDTLAGTDFFTLEIWSLGGLMRYHVLFVIELATRRVHIAGIVHEPNGARMSQTARNLTDIFAGFLLGKIHLVHDRDPLFTKSFCDTLASVGVKSVRLPAKSPNLNAFAERFVLSIKSECLNRIIFFTEAQLRHTVREFVEHYHRERNHQGIGNRLLAGDLVAANTDGEIRCRQRLGGLLKYYHRHAA